MKCPNCTLNQRRGREGMVCKSCSYRFLFDPKSDHLSAAVGLHDHLFEKIINHASANGTYYFTPNQFFSSARHFGHRSLLPFLFFVVLALLFFFGFSFGDFVVGQIFIGAMLTLIGIVVFTEMRKGSGPKRKKWDRLVKKWLKSKREIPGLINSPALSNPPPQWQEKDIYDYGVSGIILCDRQETVDWLVFNQFHTQTNTLILTAEGYPTYLAPIAKQLLEESPDLKVWLLHDAATSATKMKKHCFLPLTQVIDLGLNPDTLSRLTVLRKRFGRGDRSHLPLDVVPYRTLSAALTHCLTTGVLLHEVLGANLIGSDTDVSFG